MNPNTRQSAISFTSREGEKKYGNQNIVAIQKTSPSRQRHKINFVPYETGSTSPSFHLKAFTARLEPNKMQWTGVHQNTDLNKEHGRECWKKPRAGTQMQDDFPLFYLCQEQFIPVQRGSTSRQTMFSAWCPACFPASENYNNTFVHDAASIQIKLARLAGIKSSRHRPVNAWAHRKTFWELFLPSGSHFYVREIRPLSQSSGTSRPHSLHPGKCIVSYEILEWDPETMSKH